MILGSTFRNPELAAEAYPAYPSTRRSRAMHEDRARLKRLLAQ